MAEASSSKDNTGAGLVAMATGIVVALFVHLAPQPGDAPVLIGDACAAAFFCAGLSIVAGVRGWSLLGKLAGLAAAYMLVVPGAWVALAGDTGRCSIGVALSLVALDDIAAAGLCRTVFGVGTALTLLIAIGLTWSAFRHKPGPAAR